MAGGEFRYHLELVPLSGPGQSGELTERASPANKSLANDAEWELVSTKVLDDGRTEQRLYRRPA